MQLNRLVENVEVFRSVSGMQAFINGAHRGVAELLR